MRAVLRNRGLTAATLVLFGLALAFSPGAFASGGRHGGAKKVTCRGPASLSGGFALSNHRKVIAKRTDCKTARKLVKRFPEKCADAYAAQGRCKIRTSGRRWRCRSRLAGSLEDGAPSKEKCKRRRSRVKFEVVSEPPLRERNDWAETPRALSGPYNEAQDCIDVSRAGTVIPPPPLSVAPFEIRVLAGVPRSVGRSLQRSLLDHRVAAVLHDGLAVHPRIYPKRLPILLTPGSFNSTGDWDGLTLAICGNRGADAVIARTDGDQSRLAPVTAHELFHAHSDAINPLETWWEEASANWSEQKEGYPAETGFDINLQFPNRAIDTTDPDQYPYGMWRFVQFLDTRGFVGGGGGRWQLQRQVIPRYPDATDALASALDARGTALGAQVAAFWGDRLREQPLHGPQLRPSGANSDQIEVEPGATQVPAVAKRLHTKLLDFKLSNQVARVEFEFFPPADGYFWGLVKGNESQRFLSGDSIAFCVGEPGDQGELRWPGNFPVTFTNGKLSAGQLEGEIVIHAQADEEQCRTPTPDNRACRLLAESGVSGLLGPGSFPFSREDRDEEAVIWICFYTGSTGEVNLNLLRARNRTARQVREGVRRQIEQLNLQRIDGVGDLAGIGTFDDGETTYSLLVMAVGKENALMTVGPGAQRQNTIKLAKRIAGQID